MNTHVDPATVVTGRRSRRLQSISTSLIWGEAQADARALGSHSDPRRLMGGALGVADAAMIAVAAGLAYILRHGLTALPLDVATTVVLAVVLTVNALYLSGAYTTQVPETLAQQSLRAMQVWTAVFAILLLLGYLTKTSDSYSRAWAVIWYAGALVLMLGVRCVTATQMRRWRARGRLAGTVAIVDLCGAGDALGTRIRRQFRDHAHLVGVFRLGAAGAGTEGDGAAVPDAIDELLSLSRLFRIDDVMVVISSATRADLTAVLRRLGTIPTNVHLCPLMPDVAATPIRTAGMLFDQPALTIHRKPLGGLSSILKRAEDIVVGSLALIVLAPVMLAAAACIRAETQGPVLFRQARQGFNNNVFTVFKFRTMVHRARPEAGVPQATRNDPRVTRVGRVLRRTSLDELPQLFNVLRGEMSLVGPRPHAVAHNELYETLIDDYLGRHKVQPGITGWAQVNGLRGETDTLDKMQRRVQFDLAYIDRWSILFDIKIIVLTAVTALFDRKAY